MPHKFLDIIFSLMALVAILERHHLLFASIASICTIVYWLWKFSTWATVKVFKFIKND